ncbi:AP endonuclease [Spirochaetia bacterium]|nr:AP endonuclease [Spirochaetia bacterium]
MIYPKLYLAVDNCFAHKRWTKPEEWCGLIADLGVNYIEASADTELDPLYMGREYLKDWVKDAKAAQKTTGVEISSLYSGHGTYTTLGLAHTDTRVRRHMLDHWFKPMADIAGELGAGLGFFAHGFPHRVLQDETSYNRTIDTIKQGLVEINKYSSDRGSSFTCIEQMYTPHQYPWTIRQTRDLIRSISKDSGTPFYFTEDLGHHHTKFLKPPLGQEWFGSDKAFRLAEKGEMENLKLEMKKTPYLFSEPEDNDCYAWLSSLGKYCPVIHLQQTNGQCSEHRPFTPENNKWGIIEGGKLILALKKAYESFDTDMPEPCSKIYLTLELFAGTSAIMQDFLISLKESILYWRRFIPHDGLPLDELAASLSPAQEVVIQ